MTTPKTAYRCPKSLHVRAAFHPLGKQQDKEDQPLENTAEYHVTSNNDTPLARAINGLLGAQRETRRIYEKLDKLRGTTDDDFDNDDDAETATVQVIELGPKYAQLRELLTQAGLTHSTRPSNYSTDPTEDPMLADVFEGEMSRKTAETLLRSLAGLVL